MASGSTKGLRVRRAAPADRRRPVLAGLLVCFSLAILTSGCRSPEVRAYAGPVIGQKLTGRVVSVADGDTVTILVGRRQVRVRLHGIDAPERTQDFSDRAKRFLSDRVFNQILEVTVTDIDHYGRSVCVVRLPGSGKSLNEELVEQGLAWAYRRYSSDYVGDEMKARRARSGLWSLPNPQPPWDFRRRPPPGR